MHFQFLGATQTVTGSMHRITTNRASVLLDAGLYQGRRQESFQRNRNLPVDPRELAAVVLSHAHIDHSGALPVLVKHGYAGPIYVTSATRDLCAAMLEDSAMIQAADARFINRAIERDGANMDPVEPLYDLDDVTATLARMTTLPYHASHRIAPGITLTFFDAGHVLGSAVVVLDVEEDGRERRVVFSGDLGRRGAPILRDPEAPPGAHALVMESTYGDRMHQPFEALEERLTQVLATTHARRGKVIIPCFALERAQEIIYALGNLKHAGKLPNMPVYVDSPLTVKVTDVFRMHPECYDREARELLTSRRTPFDFEGLHYVSEKEESKAIDANPEPCIILSASGMCEAGRVVHHLKASLEDARNTIVIVGFQAQHTLGRRLVEERARVKIFGVVHERRAEVVVLDGFSAHADRVGLASFARSVRAQGSLDSLALVHGEPAAQESFAALLRKEGFSDVRVPARGDTMPL